MHRVHDSERARAAVGNARAAGFRNISIDLIFALPRQLNRNWEQDLAAALSLQPNHISLYGLTVEKATPVARWTARGEITPADDDLYAEDFLLAHSMASEAGFEHYEVSNFALPGQASRHNSAYWTGAAYIGVGPSAHSFDGSVRTWNVAAYADWLARLDRGQTAVAGAELLTAENRAAEAVYLGLRTTKGYRAGADDLSSAATWEKAGWARIHDGVIRLEPEGWLRLDSLAAGLTGF
jgi:oxygen-independent coproporphyrinogen-3 oxidase